MAQGLKIAEKQSINLDGVIVTAVTSPNRIKDIATERGISTQDVFVRVTFKYKEEYYTSSNKLKFFRQEGYQQLLDSLKNSTPLDITVTISDKGDLMYINNKTSVDDLFKDVPTVVDNRKSITDLLNSL